MASINPKARIVTLAYPKGSLSCPLGWLEYLFPDFKPVWGRPIGTTPSGRVKQFRHTKRTLARAGQPVEVILTSGESVKLRVTGPVSALIELFEGQDLLTKIFQVRTPRGTEFCAKPEMFGTVGGAAA